VDGPAACWLGPAFGADVAGWHCDVIHILWDDVWTIRCVHIVGSVGRTMALVIGTLVISSGIRCIIG